MTMKSVESAVRELQQIVTNLVSEVKTLKCTITEQAQLINKLTTPIEKAATRKSLVANIPSAAKSAMTATAPVQRSVRTARVQASLAIANLANPARKRSNACASTATTPKSDTLLSACGTGQMTGTKEITESVSTAATITMNSDLIRTTSSDNTLDESKCDDFQQVVNKRRRRKQLASVIVGTATPTSNDLQAAERRRHIQAWSFKPDTTREIILCFLNKITTSDYTVEKRDIKSNRHASFIIGMPENIFATVTSPTAWPAGIRFTEWFLYRPRTQRGSESTSTTSSGSSGAGGA